MDELHVLLMLPRGTVPLLDGATSSSMLRRDSETECVLEGLDGDSDDDDRVFLPRMMFMISLILPCCTKSQNNSPGGFLLVGKQNAREKYGGWSVRCTSRLFLE
jgi:hypothetical protein